jgi:predicted ribosome quality control (RQC) complex YloA/Tae2 family protein
MEVELELGKSVEENASVYFEKSKKARKKLAGLQKAIIETEKRLDELKQSTPREKQKKGKNRKPKWYESFHWFYTSDGLLVIGGKNAQSNEVVVKKHLQKEDLFLHADIQGGSGCVIKKAENASAHTKQEAAVFAATFSKAWKQGLAGVDVYCVKPDQVSKHAPSGESLGMGAFMIRGKRDWYKGTPLNCWVGVQVKQGMPTIISGPEAAIKKHSIISFNIIQGNQDANTVAKKIVKVVKSKLPAGTKVSVDDVLKMLPSGGMELYP